MKHVKQEEDYKKTTHKKSVVTRILQITRQTKIMFVVRFSRSTVYLTQWGFIYGTQSEYSGPVPNDTVMGSL